MTELRQGSIKTFKILVGSAEISLRGKFHLLIYACHLPIWSHLAVAPPCAHCIQGLVVNFTRATPEGADK